MWERIRENVPEGLHFLNKVSFSGGREEIVTIRFMKKEKKRKKERKEELTLTGKE